MEYFNRELNHIHIAELQSRRNQERLIKEAKQAGLGDAGNWLNYWRERRAQARLRRVRRAELLRQEWEVAPHK